MLFNVYYYALSFTPHSIAKCFLKDIIYCSCASLAEFFKKYLNGLNNQKNLIFIKNFWHNNG